MVWFFVDDGFSDSKPVMSMPDDIARGVPVRLAACGLWVLAGSWSAKEETDGFVPENMVRRLLGTGVDEDGNKRYPLRRHGPVIRALTEGPAPLCSEVEGGGLQFENWSKWQLTSDELRTKRARNAAKQAKWRADNKLEPLPKRRGRTASSSENVKVLPVTDGVTPESCNQVSNRAQTRPDQKKDISSLEEHASYVSHAPARDDSFAPPSDDSYRLATASNGSPSEQLSPPVSLGASRLVALACAPGTVDDAARTILRIKTSEGLAQGRTEDQMAECLRVWLSKPHLGPSALLACLTEVDKARLNGHRQATSDRNFAATQALKTHFANHPSTAKELDT